MNSLLAPIVLAALAAPCWAQVDDFIAAPPGATVEFNVLVNDGVSMVDILGLWLHSNPAYGAATLDPDGAARYRSIQGGEQFPEDSFRYQYQTPDRAYHTATVWVDRRSSPGPEPEPAPVSDPPRQDLGYIACESRLHFQADGTFVIELRIGDCVEP